MKQLETLEELREFDCSRYVEEYTSPPTLFAHKFRSIELTTQIWEYQKDCKVIGIKYLNKADMWEIEAFNAGARIHHRQYKDRQEVIQTALKLLKGE